MKPSCFETQRVQDYLDDALAPAEVAVFRDHLRGCTGCAAELAAWTRVFHTLDSTPLLDPGPALTERVLAAVVPFRIRRRWLRTVGWTYAGSLGASVVAAVVAANLPGARLWVDVASAEASSHVVQLVMFVLNTLAFATLGIANGWGALASLASRIAPLPRALGSLLQHPPVEVALWAAAVICIALLWWLHGRDRSASRRIDPLGLMGV